MPRPLKTGVDYFPLDVNLEDEVELIESEHTIVGFAVLMKLYQKIYASNYWVKWDKKDIIVFSKRVNVNIDKVNAIINSCFEWGIFDENLYKKYEILTSNGIQKRFFIIVKRRKKIPVIKEYLLTEIDNDVDINLINVSESTQSKPEESKPDESIKEKPELFEKAFEKWWLNYPKRNGRRIGKKEAKAKFMKLKQSEWKNLNTATINYSNELSKSGLSPSDAHRFLNETWKEYIVQADDSMPNNQEKISHPSHKEL